MMQDCNIVELFWQRDEQAIKETAEKYGSYCYHIAYNILYSDLDAEECVNDTYVKAWESMPPHKPEKLSTYLGKLTRNIAINRYVHDRAQKRNAETDLVFDELSYLIPDSQTSNLPDEVALKDAIKDKIKTKDNNLVGKMASEGTTPRRLTDLIGSLCDLTSGSGDKGTPIVFIQGYFDNYTTD